jgi:hypothetical protein
LKVFFLFPMRRDLSFANLGQLSGKSFGCHKVSLLWRMNNDQQIVTSERRLPN